MSEESSFYDVLEQKIERTPAVIVGIGGSGVKTLLKLKKHLELHAPDSLDQKKGNIRLFGIDLEPWRRDNQGVDNKIVPGTQLERHAEYFAA